MPTGKDKNDPLQLKLHDILLRNANKSVDLAEDLPARENSAVKDGNGLALDPTTQRSNMAGPASMDTPVPESKKHCRDEVSPILREENKKGKLSAAMASRFQMALIRTWNVI